MLGTPILVLSDDVGYTLITRVGDPLFRFRASYDRACAMDVWTPSGWAEFATWRADYPTGVRDPRPEHYLDHTIARSVLSAALEVLP